MKKQNAGQAPKTVSAVSLQSCVGLGPLSIEKMDQIAPSPIPLLPRLQLNSRIVRACREQLLMISSQVLGHW